MVKSMLADARALYLKSEAGIAALPMSARTGIFAARYIYAAIGSAVARNGYDSVTHRGRSSKAQKIALIGKSAVRAGGSLVLPTSPILFAQPLDEVRFLVDAVAINRPRAADWGEGRTGSFLSVMAELKTREQNANPSNGVAAE